MLNLQEAYKKIPDTIIELFPEMKISWIYDNNSNQLSHKIIGFKIRVGKGDVEYWGDDVVLQQLKVSFSKYVF